MPVNGENNTILIISHISPANPSAGNEKRLSNLIRWLRTEGYWVELLLNVAELPRQTQEGLEDFVDAVHTLSSRSIVEKLRDMFFSRTALNFHSVVEKLSSHSLVNLSARLCERLRPTAVIAEYIFAAPCLAAVSTNSLKIIDTHDMYSRRHPDELYYCSPELERELLLHADIVMAIQPEEAEAFTRLVPERAVITTGVDYEVVPKNDEDAIASETVLLVGSDNPANIDGFNQFFCFAWPAIRSRCPSARLRVVGKVGNHFHCSDDRIDIIGRVESLDDEYARASVVINPTVYGTGLKIKTVEALCHGKAMVATSNSVEGLESPPCIVSDDWKEFGNSVITLLNNADRRRELQSASESFARERFSPEKVYVELKDVLKRRTK